MRLASTSGHAPTVSFAEAVLTGLAPDGGLYLPETVPSLTAETLAEWRGLSFPNLACRLAVRWLSDELAEPEIERLVSEALDIPVPIVDLRDGRLVLELFHGPTLAFKDFGARFLARCVGHLIAGRGGAATVLVATSGDTGSAVARGFAGVSGIRVVVLYPRGKVSPFQEAQMATVGGTVTAVRVPGTFDDCQRLVKAAFLDPSLASLGLSSANSINIGRLLPQSFYYVFGYLAAVSRPGDPLIFAVPSGNLGNLTAGILARRMGLPATRFIAATNANDVLPDYLATGTYRARPSVATLSNAMDVGDPNNFPRLAALCGGRVETMRDIIEGRRVSEEETRREIRDTWRARRYVLDPHGAVACAAARDWQASRPEKPRVMCLATAHPAKFADVIASDLGFEPELPAHERDWRARPLLAVDLPDTAEATLRDFLLSVPRAM